MPDQQISRDDLNELKQYIRELFDQHERIHTIELRERNRELQLADAKFVKANEVREQIDRERGTFVTDDKFATLEKEVTSIKTERGTFVTDDKFTALEKEITLIRTELSDFRGKWSILILGLAAGISVLTFIVEKVVALTLGIK